MNVLQLLSNSWVVGSLVAGIRSIFRVRNLGLWGNALLGDLSKKIIAVFKRVSEKNTEISKRLGRQARPSSTRHLKFISDSGCLYYLKRCLTWGKCKHYYAKKKKHSLKWKLFKQKIILKSIHKQGELFHDI